MMGFIKRFMDGRQKGFTLVELLIAMLLTALIGTSLVVIVTQMYAIPNHNSAHLTAVMQVDNAVRYHYARRHASTDDLGHYFR